MMIHRTAIVHPDAHLEVDVQIGAYSVIGPNVSIGKGTIIGNHVVVASNTKMGQENKVFSHAVIGDDPQDLSYKGQDSYLEVGDRNIIREGVTINRASEKEAGVTRVGDDNFLMAYSHVAHDCQLGNHITIANNTLLQGI